MTALFYHQKNVAELTNCGSDIVLRTKHCFKIVFARKNIVLAHYTVGLWQIKVFLERQQCFSPNILFNVQFPIQMYYSFEHYFIESKTWNMWRVLNRRNFRKSIKQCFRYRFVTIKCCWTLVLTTLKDWFYISILIFRRTRKSNDPLYKLIK